MDDLVLTGNDNVFLAKFIASLFNRFSMKDLGILKYFLDIEALFTLTDLFLTQQHHLKDLLDRTHMA